MADVGAFFFPAENLDAPHSLVSPLFGVPVGIELSFRHVSMGKFALRGWVVNYPAVIFVKLHSFTRPIHLNGVRSKDLYTYLINEGVLYNVHGHPKFH